MPSYKKRFSTDVSLDYTTFLNDKKISGEIYAYLLAKSIVETQPDGTKRTLCPKEAVNKTQLADDKVFGDITRQTIGNRINKLAERGYITIDNKKGYYLNIPTQRYKDIPIETLEYLITIFKAPVIRVYLFLGARQEWAQKEYHRNYNFTKEDLIQHCGINIHQRQEYKTVDMILTALNQAGLISTRRIEISDASNLKNNYKFEITYWTDKVEINPNPGGTVKLTETEASLPEPEPEEVPKYIPVHTQKVITIPVPEKALVKK